MKKENQSEKTEDQDLENMQKETAGDNPQQNEKNEAETYLENWKRTQADFINYKRRAEQEKEETIKFGNSILLAAILPVLDDLQRALGSVPEDAKNLPWVEGIKLIERKFNSALESQGVKAVKTEGEAFDPKLHEAALHVNGEDGIIINELQKGYKLYDRVIRPAMVTVGNGEK
ncbi:MAG: nucleotide exchange factor GrpE [Dehalococcoidales bacterium]